MKKIKQWWGMYRKEVLISLFFVSLLTGVVYLLLTGRIPAFIVVLKEFAASNSLLLIGTALLLISLGIWIYFARWCGVFAERWRTVSFFVMTAAALLLLLSRDVVVLSSSQKALIENQWGKDLYEAKKEVADSVTSSFKKEKDFFVKRETVLQQRIDSLHHVATVLSEQKSQPLPIVDSLAIVEIISKRTAVQQKTIDTIPSIVSSVVKTKNKSPVLKKRRYQRRVDRLGDL